MAVERLALALLTAVDAILIGRYVGDDALAAVGLAGILMWLPTSGAHGLATATTTVIGWDVGSSAVHRLRDSVRTSILIGLIFGAVSSLLFVSLAGPMLNLMGLEPVAHKEGVDYLTAASFMILGFGALEAVSGALRGAGDTRTPMLIVLFINVFNAGLTYSLISGSFGLEMGSQGAGIGSAAGALAGGGIALLVLARGRAGLKWEVRHALRVSRAATRRILELAVPITLGDMQFMVAFLVYTRIIASLGTQAVAAHTVAIRTIDLGVMPGFALGTAVTALIGQSLGAERRDLAKQVATSSLQIALFLMMVMGAAAVLFAPQLSSLYTDSPEVQAEATKALRVFAIGLPGLGIMSAYFGVLRGAGDVRWTLIMMTVSVWALRVPGAFVGAHILHWGLAGAWMGAALELNGAAILSVVRVHQGKWLERRV